MNKILRLTPNGSFEESKPVEELPVGMKIFSIGAYTVDKVYCVAGKRDERGQQKIVLASECPENESFAPFCFIDAHVLPISKKFGIGFYWDDIDHTIFSEEDVNAFIDKAGKETARIEQKSQEKAEQDKRERAALPSLFPHLKPIGEHPDYKDLRANIVADLKRHFPHQKFSVKKRHYGSIDISWTDGISRAEVERVTGKFVDHETDYTGDFRDYNPSNFNRVFGGIDYIFEEREMSDEVRNCVGVIGNCFPEMDKQEHTNILYRVFCKTSFPQNATNIRLVRNESACGSVEDLFSFEYNVPQTADTNNPQNVSDLKIVDYSEKAFAVYGNTYPVKDKLFDLGGKFNRNLKDGPGFIFSKRDKEQVERFVKDLSEKA